MRLKIVGFCYHKIPSAVLAIIKPMEVLQKEQLVDFLYANSMEVTHEVIDTADVIISIRGAEPIDLQWVQRAKEKGKKVVYYLDDDVLNLNAYVYTYNKSYFQREDIKNNVKNIMRSCDILWTSNQRIINKYKAYFNRAYVMKAPALLLTSQKVEKESIEPITIGFAGGIDHREFYEKMLCQPLQQLLLLYSNQVKFEVFGFQTYLLYHLPITTYPYIEDYDDYMLKMKSFHWDIAVAPLPDTPFHACKHFNKYLEYGALKIPGIYSNVPPYSDVIEDGVNGLLVDNTEKDWLSGLKRLIDNKGECGEIREKAYDHIKAHYHVSLVAKDMYHKLHLVFRQE